MKVSLREPYNRFFGTLANQFRLDILTCLMDGPKSVTQICCRTAFEQSIVSHNLKRLQICGFVLMRPKGKERIYSINSKTIRPLFTLMQSHMKNHCALLCGGTMVTLKVKGMHCKSCVALITDALEEAGMTQISIDLDAKAQIGTVSFQGDLKKATKLIEQEGFSVL